VLWDDGDMTLAGRGRGGETPVGRTGVVLRDPLPWPQLRQVVETAEQTGYEAVFLPEIAGREAFTTLVGFAVTTARIRLGTGVVSVRSRTPAITAMATATLDDLSDGRAILGLGSGSPSGQRGQVPSLELVDRYLRLVRSILAGDQVPADPTLGTPAFRLELQHPGAVPIWLASLGDRMIGLAGRLADGVLLNWCTPERVAAARRVLAESAEDAGRDPAALSVAVYVRACLEIDEDVALSSLKEMAGRYASIPHYRRQFEAMGLGEGAALAAKAFEGNKPEEVPDGLVRAVAIVGGRREALRRFTEYREAGADLVLCYPVTALDRYSSLLGTVLGAAPSPSLDP
jgi:5,10-methylenetetrahydromethanopterin reductase